MSNKNCRILNAKKKLVFSRRYSSPPPPQISNGASLKKSNINFLITSYTFIFIHLHRNYHLDANEISKLYTIPEYNDLNRDQGRPYYDVLYCFIRNFSKSYLQGTFCSVSRSKKLCNFSHLLIKLFEID